VLVLVQIDAAAGRLTVNCEQLMLGSNISKTVKDALN
jgi:hypothetical protein